MLDPREIAPETPRLIRRVEYEKMGELGMFDDERVELLYGVIIPTSPRSAPHDSTIDRVTELLITRLVGRAWVRVQGSFAASEYSQPEPDCAVYPRDDYDRAHPTHAWLVVEVSGSSLRKDRGPKARLYAETDVGEYWIVNLDERVIEVHTDPRCGRYANIETYRPGQSITLRRFPDVVIAVDDVLPR